MELSVNYEGWKATIDVTDYMTGQLPILRVPPYESEQGWAAEIDYVIKRIENESGEADPMMLFHFDSSAFSDAVFEAWGNELEEANHPDFDDFYEPESYAAYG
jgi:hypothetical protein